LELVVNLMSSDINQLLSIFHKYLTNNHSFDLPIDDIDAKKLYSNIEELFFTEKIIQQSLKTTYGKLDEQLKQLVQPLISSFANISALLKDHFPLNTFVYDIAWLIVALTIQKEKKLLSLWSNLWTTTAKTRSVPTDETGALEYFVPLTFYPIIHTNDKEIQFKLVKIIIKQLAESFRGNEFDKEEYLRQISKITFFSDFHFTLDYFKVILETINDPEISLKQLANKVGRHYNTIRKIKTELLKSRILQNRYRHSLRAVGLGSALVLIKNLPTTATTLEFIKGLPGIKAINPWFFRLYYTREMLFIFLVIPDSPQGKQMVHEYSKQLQQNSSLEIETLFSDNEYLLRNYNFSMFDPLYNEWNNERSSNNYKHDLVSREQQIDTTLAPPIAKLFLEHKIIWGKRPTFPLEKLHFQILDFIAKRTQGTTLAFRRMRETLKVGQMILDTEFKRLKDEKLIIPYADIFARSFTNSQITLWEPDYEKQGNLKENPMKQFPISWTSPYKDHNGDRLLLSISSLIEPYSAEKVLRQATNVYLTERLVPNQILSNNWRIPVDRWDFNNQNWKIEQADFS
jgi:hypothetical protein